MRIDESLGCGPKPARCSTRPNAATANSLNCSARVGAADAWEPPVDVFADGAEVQITIALPGAPAEDVSVQLTPTGLQIDALVSPPALGARMNVVRLEIPYGRMRRRIDLPPGRYAVVERRHDHGCLFLRLTGPAR